MRISKKMIQNKKWFFEIFGYGFEYEQKGVHIPSGPKGISKNQKGSSHRSVALVVMAQLKPRQIFLIINKLFFFLNILLFSIHLL